MSDSSKVRRSCLRQRSLECYCLIFCQDHKSKADIIEERRSNLPLPEDPPVASDWNSADASKVNVGSGGVESDISYGGGSDSLRGPATSDSSMRTDGETFNKHSGAPNEGIGRQGKDNLGDLPKDALKK